MTHQPDEEANGIIMREIFQVSNDIISLDVISFPWRESFKNNSSLFLIKELRNAFDDEYYIKCYFSDVKRILLSPSSMLSTGQRFTRNRYDTVLKFACWKWFNVTTTNDRLSGGEYYDAVEALGQKIMGKSVSTPFINSNDMCLIFPHVCLQLMQQGQHFEASVLKYVKANYTRRTLPTGVEPMRSMRLKNTWDPFI